MFLSGSTVWLGWALFYGSVLIGIVAVVRWVLLNGLKVPQEEAAWSALRRSLS